MLATLLGACAGGDAPPGSAVTRDSSGIRIVEFGAGAPAATGIWRLADEPEVALDNREDDPMFQFFRVVDALSLPGGELAVANGGTSEIRIFDAQGLYVRTVGGEGEGPGEFRSLSWIELREPDSLLTADARLRRITVFDANGLYARSMTTVGASQSPERTAMSPPEPIGLFRDGSFLTTSSDRPAIVAGPVRLVVSLERFTPDGTSSDPLGSFPGNEMHLVLEDGRLGVFMPPFARTTRFVVEGDRFWVADSERWELRGYTATGQLSILVRRLGGEVEITGALLEALIREKYENSADSPGLERAKERQREIAYHIVAPAFDELRVGTDGRLWVRSYALPGDTTVQWLSLTPDGMPSAYVTLAVGLDVLRFGSDDVIVLLKDEVERESVRRYRLVRE